MFALVSLKMSAFASSISCPCQIPLELPVGLPDLVLGTLRDPSMWPRLYVQMSWSVTIVAGLSHIVTDPYDLIMCQSVSHPWSMASIGLITDMVPVELIFCVTCITLEHSFYMARCFGSRTISLAIVIEHYHCGISFPNVTGPFLVIANGTPYGDRWIIGIINPKVIEVWIWNKDGITPKVHPTAQVDVNARFRCEFATN